MNGGSDGRSEVRNVGEGSDKGVKEGRMSDERNYGIGLMQRFRE